MAEDRIYLPYVFGSPRMDRSVPEDRVKPGTFGRLVGVDGRFNGCLHKFYGMREVLDIDGVSGMGGIDTYDGPSYFKAVTFQKKDTSTIYRGFVIRWDSQNDNTDEQVDLIYTSDGGSNWARHAIWAAGNSVTSSLQIDCAVDRGFLMVAVDSLATKTVYWNGSALTTVSSGPGGFVSAMREMANSSTASSETGYNLRGNGTYQTAYRFYDSNRGIYSALSKPVTTRMDLFKTTKATATISFVSGGGDSGLMIEGDYFEIQSRKYEYISDNSADVVIGAAAGATIAEHAEALSDAINGDSSAVVTAVAQASSVLLTAIARGTGGNAYTLAKTETGGSTDDITISGATFSEGGNDTTDPEEECSATLAFPNLGAQIPDTNLVAHWTMDDNAATTTVVDTTGDYDGTLSGGENTEDIDETGEIQGALNFNGSDHYVDSGDTFQSTFRGSFSFSYWMKPDDGQPDPFEVPLGSIDGNSLVAFDVLTTGKVTFQINSEGNSARADTASAVFADGAASAWTHIVGVADATVDGIGGLKIYVNGVEVTLDDTYDGDTTDVLFSEWTSAQNLYVGAYNQNGTDVYNFAGGLDNVQLFNKALSAEEVALLADDNYTDQAALFDTVDVFRTIDLGTSSTTQGAIFYLEQSISKPTDWADEDDWDALTVKIGTVMDDALPFLTMYDPQKDIVTAPPQSGTIGRYGDLTFMAQAASVDGGYDTLHSSMEHTSPEYFSTYNKREGDPEDGRPLRFIAAGDSMFQLSYNAVTHVFKQGRERPLQFTRLHAKRGVVAKGAAHASGNSIFLVSGLGLGVLNATDGSMGSISAADRVIFDEWKAELNSIESCYDALLNASFFLNPTQREILCLWHSTRTVSFLEGANFVGASEGPDITNGRSSRGFFITATGLVVSPDSAEAGSGSMWDLSSSYTMDGTITDATGTTIMVEADATFHADMVGARLYMTSGDNAGEDREISAVDVGNDKLTVGTSFSNDISLGDRYSVGPVPFSVRAWALQNEEVSPFTRWVTAGVALMAGGLSGFSSNDNNYWRVSVYREGSSTLEDVDVEIEVTQDTDDSAGALNVDGITLEPYIEQISVGTKLELTGAEFNVSQTDSRSTN